MTSTAVAFGSLLRSYRQSRGLTQRELARRVGVEHTYISHVEHGRMRVSRATATRLAEELGANVELMVRALGWHRCPSCREMHRAGRDPARMMAYADVVEAVRALNRFPVIDLDEHAQIVAFDALTDALARLDQHGGTE